MKLKVFNESIIALMLMSVFSLTAFSQQIPAAPPVTPKAQDHAINDNDDININVNINLEKLKTTIKNLSTIQGKQVELAMQDLGKSLEAGFKDFGDNFDKNFNVNIPDISIDIDNPARLSEDDYKQQLADGKLVEKIKNYSKSYSVDGNDVLQINNTFGKITVNTWNKNEFKVDVQMKFGARDESTVNYMADGSSISSSKTGSVVSFKTNLFNGNSGNNNRTHIEINYTVYMPASNGIDITNRFGSVSLPELSGKTLLRVSYGGLTAAGLTNTENDVKVSYGDANITDFNSGKLRVSYGSLKTGTVNNIDAHISFSSIDIDRLKGAANVDIKYGDGFRIGTIDKTVSNINVDAAFTNIDFDFKNSEAFNFDVTTKMGGFDFNDDKVKCTYKSTDEQKGWSSTKTYKGYIGKANTNGKIIIRGNFTQVNFQ
ncbi:hypothetical protein [Mucilaginibacter segetis]|uniref:Adhesin domain-containing protein n=1 Tax=Mucilaginibacter segetis TaxID=2793071 RepID=A0A934PV67_9SPHI|nr:hypothetical protein [Mucilaginibacter segetis]MBK0380232.1 hypothetical protein [Mucilaginibacter segetis]